MQTDAILVEEAIKRVANNKKLFHRLLGNFSGRTMLGEISKAVDNKDFDEAAKKCHALRGLAANLAMHPLAKAAFRLEDHFKAEEVPEGWLNEMNEIIAAVEIAISEILAE